MNTNDSNNNGNGAHYGMMPFAPPPRHPSEYTQLIPGPPMNSYPQSMISGNYGSSSSAAVHSPTLEYPPVTPPNLTHSRRGSRESRESSSSQSTPSTGASGPGTHGGLVHRHKRGHLSSSMSPPSPTTALRKSRKAKKKDQVEDVDEDGFSDEDPIVSQKLRREDAKKSRQDAEQKRRDQLKGAYDQLRLVVPGSTEKTSKVMLVNHARQHIEKLSRDKHELLVRQERTEEDVNGLRLLNERLLKKLSSLGIDFKEDLEATGMELPPEELQRLQQPRPTLDLHLLPSAPMSTNGGAQHGSQPASNGTHFTPHRGGHSRNSSNVSMGNYVSDSSMSMAGPSQIPMSTYPPLPPSTPATPMRTSMIMGPPSSAASQPGMPPQLHLTLPGGMHGMTSPTSSIPSASASGGRPPHFAPDMSASMMGVDHGEYMQHSHASQQRGPHQAYQDEPSHRVNGSSMTADHGFPHPGMPMQGHPASRDGRERQGMASQESGLPHGNESQVPTMSSSLPEHSQLIIPDHQLHRTMSHPGPSTFMSGDLPTFYPPDGHEPPNFEYYPQEDRHPGADMYLPGSPGGSQALSPHGGQPGQQQLLQVNPHAHGQHLLVGSHGMVPHLSASPHQSDRSGPVHSPLMGSFSDGPHHSSETGIAPSMLMGEVNPSDRPMGTDAPPSVNGTPVQGSWYMTDPSHPA